MNSQSRVLIVERDKESVTALEAKLSQAGFKVSTLGPEADARAAIERDDPHLVMIDWDLPAVIAIDLVRHIRSTRQQRGPRLIALSSFSSEHHVLSGFEHGVDDYVVKPFSVLELVARVRALLRSRVDASQESPYLEFHELQMDADERRVTILDKTVLLRNMEFELLHFMMRRPERAYSRETLLRQVWGRDSNAGMRAVDVTIQRIRRVLDLHGCAEYLQTIRGVGYRLSASAS